MLHVAFFSLLFSTLSFETKQPPIIINLQQDPGIAPKKIVQATLIDKRAADLALQRQLAAEKLKRDKIIEQQQKIEQQRLEIEQAKQDAEQAKESALELAKQKQAKLEATKVAAEKKATQERDMQIKKQVAAQQQQLRKEAQEKQIKQQAVAKQQADVLAKQQAKAAAVKSEHNRMLAEQQAILASEVEKYRAEFAAAIEENRIISAVFATELRCKLRIMLLPDGSLLSIKVLESSGNPAYDEMSTSAIRASAPFTMPDDPELYTQLREIVLSFKNGE